MQGKCEFYYLLSRPNEMKKEPYSVVWSGLAGGKDLHCRA